MSGRKQSAQALVLPQVDMSPLDFDYPGSNHGYDAGSGYVNPEANITNFNATSNIDPALDATKNFAPPYANPLQQFQPMPQHAPPSFSSNPADWPRTENACYHPAVGWYVPMGPSPAASVGYASPAFMGQPPALNNQLLVPVPMAPAAPLFQDPASTSVESSVSTGRKRKAGGKSPSRESSRARSQKRKYGPSAYLEEQASKRAKGDNSGPSLSHRQSVNYGSSPASRKRTPEQKKAVKEARAARAPRKTTEVSLSTKKIGQINAAIVQACSCPSAQQVKTDHIPRARNKFIIFRNDFSAKWRAPKGKGKGNRNEALNVSTAAGEAWRAMSNAEKAPYADRAKQEAAEHKLDHPDYQYNPWKGIEARFGQADCRCGAHQANMAEWRQNHGEDELEPIQEAEEEGEEDEDNITVAQHAGPVTRSRSRSLTCSRSTQEAFIAPIVQMQQMPPFLGPTLNYDQYVYDLGLTGTPMQTGFDDLFMPSELNAQPQVHFDTSSAPPQGHGESPTLRRSPRTGSKSTNYEAAPVAIDPKFWTEWTTLSPPKATSAKRRPTPISTTRKESALSAISELRKSDPRLAGMSTLSFDGPAARTRSKSVSISPSSHKTPTPKNLSDPPLGRKASTPKTPNTAEEEFELSPVGSHDPLFDSSGDEIGTPKSAASSKVSPKTVVEKPGLALPGQFYKPGLALSGQQNSKVVSGRDTRKRSRGRSRKRS